MSYKKQSDEPVYRVDRLLYLRFDELPLPPHGNIIDHVVLTLIRAVPLGTILSTILGDELMFR
jgi:hypothetical protein